MQKAQPGDYVELANKEGGFTDPETGFDISRDQVKELEGSVGERTQQAVISGGLLIVAGGKKSKAASSKATEGEGSKSGEGDESDLPEDLPGRDVFLREGLTFAQVKELNEEQLLALNGFGKKSFESLKAWAEANKDK
jgi:hypothetical protein